VTLEAWRRHNRWLTSNPIVLVCVLKKSFFFWRAGGSPSLLEDLHMSKIPEFSMLTFLADFVCVSSVSHLFHLNARVKKLANYPFPNRIMRSPDTI